MADRFRGRGGARGGGMRQRTSWNRTVATGQTVIAANTAVLVASVPAAAFAEESTIRRTILHLSVSSDQDAADELQIGCVGMFVANDNAIATGIGALLQPAADEDDEAWFLWSPFAQELRFQSGTGLNPNFATTYVIDSKAQRKVQLGQSAVLVVENTHATFGFNVMASFSLLVGFGLKRS